jgi:branched-chain amino acid transport system permease protein
VDFGTIISNTLNAAVSLEAVAYALAAIGLNMHFGYTGLLNFGQAGFMAVGAYGVGISVTYYGLPIWVGMLVGIGAAVVLALLLGLPTLRLRADYLAIVTIAASEIIRISMRSPTFREFSGGSNGLNGWAGGFYAVNPFPRGTYGIGPVSFSANRAWILLCAWILVALVSFLVYRLIGSPWGRVIRAIREDEDAVRALGKNVYSYKMQSLILGGVFGAFAGMVLAIGNSTVQPDVYAPAITFFAYAALILGGTARIMGPVAGSITFWALIAFTENLLRESVRSGLVPSDLLSGTQIGQVRFMLVGLGLILLMAFRPQGIFGNKREMALDAT